MRILDASLTVLVLFVVAVTTPIWLPALIAWMWLTNRPGPKQVECERCGMLTDAQTFRMMKLQPAGAPSIVCVDCCQELHGKVT